MRIYIRAIYLPFPNIPSFEGSVNFLNLNTETLKKPKVPFKRWMEGNLTDEEKARISAETTLNLIKDLKKSLDEEKKFKLKVTIDDKESSFEEVLKILEIE